MLEFTPISIVFSSFKTHNDSPLINSQEYDIVST